MCDGVAADRREEAEEDHVAVQGRVYAELNLIFFFEIINLYVGQIITTGRSLNEHGLLLILYFRTGFSTNHEI